MEAWDASCSLTLILAYELVSSAEPFLGSMVPLNALRNLGLLAVQSALVALVDADFLVSAGAVHDALLDGSRCGRGHRVCLRVYCGWRS